MTQPTAYALTSTTVAEFCRDVFADNLTAGWWSDLQTGERIERNVGELLMLITTEIAEAAEGWDMGLPDDKLPHRPMFQVELADTAIRVFDLGGGLGLDLGAAFGRLRFAHVRGTVAGAGTPFNLLMLVRHVSAAMEAHRRGNREFLERALATLLLGIDELATDLLAVIAEKRGYNRTRADHSIAARRAAGGKAC
jgi:hypothetical protein